MLARAIPAILAGPIAGVVLDRFDRRRIMIASDLARAVIALAFIFTINEPDNWLVYLLSGLLMFASPFFTCGRAAILPTIADQEELHTANSLTQTTQWTTLTLGTMTAGLMTMQWGYQWAFVANALSFVFSALCILRLEAPQTGFRAVRQALTEADVLRPGREYLEGIRYMRTRPLIFGIALVGVGWATGGGAAQILFSLFGELVFQRGPAGIGIIWSCAGIGLLIGGLIAHRLGSRLSFVNYKNAIVLCYIAHGAAYILFSQMRVFAFALVFIALSRAAVAISSVLNFSQLLAHVADQFRGRVFSTLETMVWTTMMLSMMAAGIASQYYDLRLIGACAGVCSSMTAVFWGWAHWTGRLPEPERDGIGADEVEVHGEPTV
jgi:MFS family permease